LLRGVKAGDDIGLNMRRIIEKGRETLRCSGSEREGRGVERSEGTRKSPLVRGGEGVDGGADQ